MKNILKISILALSFYACGSAEKVEETHEEATDAPVTLTAEQMTMAGIETGKLSKQNIDMLVPATGQIAISPMMRHTVYAVNLGYVRRVNLQVGDRVSKGSVLAVLEHPSYIEKQRELLETYSKLPFLEAELQRKQTLQEGNAGSVKNVQAAESDYQWALAHYKGLKAELALLGFNVEKLEKEGTFQTQLTVTAPASGVLSRMDMNPGKLVQPDMMLCEISDVSQPYAELQLFAHQLPNIKEGMPVDIRLTGDTKKYTGKVERIVQEIAPATKTATLRVTLNDKDAALVAGANVLANIHASSQNDWVLPKDAVLQTDKETFAFVLSGETVSLLPVQLKGESEQWIAIEADTAKTYIVKGAYYLKDQF